MDAEQQQNRFPNVSEEDIKKLLEEKDSINTRKSTLLSVNILRAYLDDKQLPLEIELYTQEELDRVLGKFYVEARTKTGEAYKRSSLFNIRHGINRYIQSKTDINIIKDEAFKSCNKLFLAAG